MQTDTSSYQIVSKADSRVMRWIGRFWPAYYHQVVTTYGKKIYLPTSWDSWPKAYQFLTIEHEKVHLEQQRHIPGPLYLFLYFFILPVFWCPFRLHWERKAFEQTIIIAAREYGASFVQNPEFREYIAKQFYTGIYGWMWPNKTAVYAWLDRTTARALSLAAESSKWLRPKS